MSVSRLIISFCLLLLQVATATAQCPDRLRIMHRMLVMKNSEKPLQEQKTELLLALDSLQSCEVNTDTVQVHILQRTGALSYLVNDYNDAVYFTLRSVDLLKSYQSSYSNVPLLIRMYYFLSIFYDSLQLTSRKIGAMDSAIHYALSYRMIDNNVLRNMMQRAEYSYNTGDYARCISEARLGEELSARFGTGSDKAQYESFFFSLRANAMIVLKEFDAAELMIQSKIETQVKAGAMEQCGFLYNLMADINTQKKKFKEALVYLNQSYESNKLLKYPIGCKQSLNNIGRFYFVNLDDPETAVKYYRRALRYNAVNDWELGIERAENANVIGNIANVFVRQHKFDSAFFYFNKAFHAINPDYDERKLLNVSLNEFSDLSLIHYLSELVKDKADAWTERYKSSKQTSMLDSAIIVYRQADALLNRIKEGQKELVSQLSWRNSAKLMYEHAIDACFIARKTDEAFYFFERSRAVLLSDRLNFNTSSTPEIQMAIASIDRRVKHLNTQIDDGPGDSALIGLQTEAYTLKRRRDELSAAIEVKNKRKAMLRINDVQSRFLDGRTSLLEIFSGDSCVYILHLTKNKVSFAKAGKQLYEKLTSDYLSFVSNPTLLNSRFTDFVKTANQLYHLIFKEISSHPARMIVSHDGVYFPFEALVTKINSNSPPDYLVENTAFSYTYSAQFLQNTRIGELAVKPTFAGFAPGSYPPAFGVSVLPGSDASISRSASNFNDKIIFAEEDATRGKFLNSYHQYTIVQLYSHASESAATGDPIIYFADSALNMSELLPVHRPVTKMIILSACETGKGRLHNGEGVFSFNRVFAELGIPSSMVNLWSVDNQSTFKITELFCKYLSQGNTSDVALQKAKQQFIHSSDSEKQLPFYWAASVITGNAISIGNEQEFPWNTLYLVTVALLTLVALVALRFTLSGTPVKNEFY